MLLRTACFLLFGLLAALWDLRTFRIPHWCSLGGTALLLCLPGPGHAAVDLLWPLVILGPLRLAVPDGLGGGDFYLSFLLAAYLGGPAWSESLLLASLLLLVASRVGYPTAGPAPPGRVRYPFAPFLVFSSVARGSVGPLGEAVTILFSFAFLLLPLPALFGESPGDAALQNEPPQIVEMEFREQPIREILLVLASATGRSIVPDQTVDGRASYFFSRIPLQAALESFCEAYGLYLLPRPHGVTLVSRVRVGVDNGAGGPTATGPDEDPGASRKETRRRRYTVDASEAPLTAVLQRLSVASGRPIRQVGLQQRRVSFHGGPLPLRELLEALVAAVPGAKVEELRTHLLLRSGPAPEENRGAWPTGDNQALYGEPLLRQEGEGRYTVSVDDTSLRELLDLLFAAEGLSYLLRGGGERRVTGIHLRDRGFSEILASVLDQAGVEAKEREGYTEILPVTGPEASPVELSIPLSRWSPEALIRLLPGELLSRLHWVPDRGAHRLLLSGAPEAVARGALLVSAVDRGELRGTPFRSFELSHAGAGELMGALPQRFAAFPMVAAPDDGALIVGMPDGALEELQRFITLFDRRKRPRFYRLAALRGEEFLERFGGGPGMPEVRVAPGGRALFAWGSDGEMANLERMLLDMDRPARQIRYDLLILQRQHRQGNTYELTAEMDNTPTGGAVALNGMFDQLLSVRFDAIAVLGYRLAAAISRGLSERSARLLADTTLYGLDGAEVTFNNTQTFRYRDLAYDEDERAVLPTGVTREITSGIRLSVTGEVVEEQQVRMRISAEYSKQGVELAEGDNPPPTSQKRVNTTVRTEAGRPIILAGLLQREREEERRPLPILGRLPLLRRLFRPGREDEEVTELVIYLVPHIERSEAVGFSGTVEQLLRELPPGE